MLAWLFSPPRTTNYRHELSWQVSLSFVFQGANCCPTWLPSSPSLQIESTCSVCLFPGCCLLSCCQDEKTIVKEPMAVFEISRKTCYGGRGLCEPQTQACTASSSATRFVTIPACALLLLSFLLSFQRPQLSKWASYLHVSESSLKSALIAIQIPGYCLMFATARDHPQQ
jgi:hypothetical protein